MQVYVMLIIIYTQGIILVKELIDVYGLNVVQAYMDYIQVSKFVTFA